VIKCADEILVMYVSISSVQEMGNGTEIIKIHFRKYLQKIKQRNKWEKRENLVKP